MDFSQFDSRTAAETAIQYQLRQQHDGAPIFDGDKPCVVLVKGVAARSIQAAVRAEAQARMKAQKGTKGTKEEEARAVEDIQGDLITAAARFVTGFQNIQRTDPDTGKLRDLTASEDDVKWFLGLNMISLPHLLRNTALTKTDDESIAAFAERQAEYSARWHKPSFAQQVLDAAQDDAGFLSRTLKG